MQEPSGTRQVVIGRAKLLPEPHLTLQTHPPPATRELVLCHPGPEALLGSQGGRNAEMVSELTVCVQGGRGSEDQGGRGPCLHPGRLKGDGGAHSWEGRILRPQTQMLTHIHAHVFPLCLTHTLSHSIPPLTQAGCAVSILRPGVSPRQMEQRLGAGGAAEIFRNLPFEMSGSHRGSVCMRNPFWVLAPHLLCGVS